MRDRRRKRGRTEHSPRGVYSIEMRRRTGQPTMDGAKLPRTTMKELRIVLISTYDLGRQPFGLASPAAFLRRAGHRVACVDVTREELSPDTVSHARLVAFFLPMHTATRLALPLIDRVRG